MSTNRRFLVSALFVAASLCSVGAARADVPPPNSEQCRGAAAGAACTTDAKLSGVCTASKCSRLDYSDGSPPGTITYDCLLCSAGDAGLPSDAGAAQDAASTAPETTKGCAIGGAPSTAAAWALAALVPLAMRRRRPRRAR